MGNIINKIIENNVLFACVIAILCIILVALVIMIVRTTKNNKKINIYEEDLEDEDIKKVKNVKKEDIIETPDVFEEEPEEEEIEEVVEEVVEEELKEDDSLLELEKKYDEEKEKEIEEVKEETKNNELAQLISKMEEDSKLKPEDVVANFEKEQEAQSIISYKELVDAVKNRQEEEYEDELEGKPLSTVSTIMEEMSNSYDEEEVEEKEEIVEEVKEEKKVEETKTEIGEKKFRKTDVISPVYGIVEDNSDDTDKTIVLNDLDLKDENFINLTNDEEVNNESLTALDEIYKQMADDLFKSNENLSETTSLDALTRNEEFLQSLKDFREKL